MIILGLFLSSDLPLYRSLCNIPLFPFRTVWIRNSFHLHTSNHNNTICSEDRFLCHCSHFCSTVLFRDKIFLNRDKPLLYLCKWSLNPFLCIEISNYQWKLQFVIYRYKLLGNSQHSFFRPSSLKNIKKILPLSQNKKFQ